MNLSPAAHNLLKGTRVYLSGPMDFVGSRVVEKYLGWRALLTPILRALEITVLDPWNKPAIRGHFEYGVEGILPSKAEYEADFWTNPATRARFEKDFWETVHIDCRMTDVSDFLISFVPTNIYSVGTVHEIVLARSQFKPVLFVSPPVKYEFFPELDGLDPHVRDLLRFYGLKENPQGIPSQWYGNIVGGHNMFDGFGWEELAFKEAGFYGKLIDSVLAVARPADESSLDYKNWREVCAWARGFEGLNQLRGGALDYLAPTNESERQLLDAEMAAPREQDRSFFWYNRAYLPQRPMLYQLLSIASGHIPPRTNVVNQLTPSGEVDRVTYEAVDDDWLLISTEAS
ncbi:MAG: hypothetical protein WEB60_11360 [Terrimicrobiaceae bacterium]